jgi:hypothetical protein
VRNKGRRKEGAGVKKRRNEVRRQDLKVVGEYFVNEKAKPGNDGCGSYLPADYPSNPHRLP